MPATMTARPVGGPMYSTMNEFKTSNTMIASFLVARGHELRRIEGPRQQRWFVFDGSAEADHGTFYTDAQPVSARRLFAAYRDLKAALVATA